jgi:arsenate reductase
MAPPGSARLGLVCYVDLARHADILVTMGCGDECPVVPGLERDDWPLEDPKGKPIERVRQIREDVESRVRKLLTEREWVRG